MATPVVVGVTEPLPPVIEAWVKQLLDPDFVNLIRAANSERIDIRLSCAKGRVARLPQITLNAGPQELVQP